MEKENFTGNREEFETALEQSGPFYDGSSDVMNGVRRYYNGDVLVAWHKGNSGYMGAYTAE